MMESTRISHQVLNGFPSRLQLAPFPSGEFFYHIQTVSCGLVNPGPLIAQNINMVVLHFTLSALITEKPHLDIIF